MAAADVRDLPAALQLLDDAVERREPGREQVGVVAGPEEALAALEHVVVVLVPADALPALRTLDDPRRVDHRAERDLEEPRQVRRAVLVGQRRRLLRRQGVAAGGRVVLDVAARGLVVQPLAHVALAGARAARELVRGERAGAGEGAVQAELVAHDDERGVERRADLVDGAEDECLELGPVDRDGLFECCHGCLPLDCASDGRPRSLPSHQGGT